MTDAARTLRHLVDHLAGGGAAHWPQLANPAPFEELLAGPMQRLAGLTPAPLGGLMAPSAGRTGGQTMWAGAATGAGQGDAADPAQPVPAEIAALLRPRGATATPRPQAPADGPARAAVRPRRSPVSMSTPDDGCGDGAGSLLSPAQLGALSAGTAAGNSAAAAPRRPALWLAADNASTSSRRATAGSAGHLAHPPAPSDADLAALQRRLATAEAAITLDARRLRALADAHGSSAASGPQPQPGAERVTAAAQSAALPGQPAARAATADPAAAGSVARAASGMPQQLLDSGKTLESGLAALDRALARSSAPAGSANPGGTSARRPAAGSGIPPAMPVPAGRNSALADLLRRWPADGGAGPSPVARPEADALAQGSTGSSGASRQGQAAGNASDTSSAAQPRPERQSGAPLALASDRLAGRADASQGFSGQPAWPAAPGTHATCAALELDAAGLAGLTPASTPGASLIGPQLPLRAPAAAQLPASDLHFTRSLERVLLAEVRSAGIDLDGGTAS
ncbi:MAG: hypothetical protein RIQ60_683 [Pseudomonadota bacterium]|jgi:hypothetical protein